MKPARRAHVVCIILGGCLSAHATSANPFDRAEQLRAALEARPESQRTQLAYNRVLDAYRAIYHGNSASPRADASVLAVAQLLTEEGRHYSDPKLLNDAIGQYEFLRRQYPASRYRFTALIAEGQIYRRDLGDRDEAKKKFQQFLKVYPQSPLAQQAKLELNDIHQEEHPSRQTRRNAVLAAAVESQQSHPASAVPAAAIQPQQTKPSRPRQP
jgi:N-acetylmuramoyl-L-alanine amidase